MYLTHYLLLVFNLSRLISAAWIVPSGCSLNIPDHVRKQPEAGGSPLVIFVDLKVLDVTNVPDKGGSYEIDLK